MPCKPDLAVLAQTVKRVFEDAAFVFLSPAESGVPPAATLMTARLAFAAVDARGALSLTATPGFANLLARNMLGLDDGAEISESSRVDALGEAVNLVAGKVLREWLGAEARYVLAAPVVGVGTPTSSGLGLAFASDEGETITLTLAADGPSVG